MSKEKEQAILSAIGPVFESITEEQLPFQYDKLSEVCLIALSWFNDDGSFNKYASLNSPDHKINTAAEELREIISSAIDYVHVFFQRAGGNNNGAAGEQAQKAEVSSIIKQYLQGQSKELQAKAAEIEALISLSEEERHERIKAISQELMVKEESQVRREITEQNQHKKTSLEINELVNSELAKISAQLQQNYHSAILIAQDSSKTDEIVSHHQEQLKIRQEEIKTRLRQEQLERGGGITRDLPNFVSEGRLMTVDQLGYFGYPEIELYKAHYESDQDKLRHFFDAIKKPYLAEPELAFKKLAEIKSEEIAGFINDSAIRLFDRQIIKIDELNNLKCFSHPRITDATFKAMAEIKSDAVAKEVFKDLSNIEFEILDNAQREASINSAISLLQRKSKEFALNYITQSEKLIAASKAKNIDELKEAIRDGALINYTDNEGQSAFIYAYEQGFTEGVIEIQKSTSFDINMKMPDGKPLLTWVIQNNNINLAAQLISDPKLSVNAKDNDGYTALMWAVEDEHIEIVAELLKHPDIDANAKNKYGETLLIWAAGNGKTEIFTELLKHPDIDANAKDNVGETLLIWAARNGRTEIFTELLKHPKLDVNANDNAGYTALILAARNGKTEIFTELLKHPKLDVNANDNAGYTALMWAVRNGHIEIVTELLKHPDIDVRAKDNYGTTALMLAARNGHIEIVTELLKHPDIDVNAKDNVGETLLIWAAQNGRTDIFTELLKHPDIDANAKNKYGTPLLVWAAMLGKPEVLTELLKHPKLDVNANDNKGNTALMWAARNGKTEIVTELLKHPKLDVNAKDNNGNTALTWAAQNGKTEIVTELLKHPKLDVNAKDNDGYTALTQAVENGHIEIVAELLKHPDIDVNAQDNKGNTALMWAAQRGKTEIFTELLKHPPDIMWAVQRGKTEIVTELLKRTDIDVNAKDKYGETALMLAVQRGKTEIVTELLKRTDIDVNAKDKYGETALMWAASLEGKDDIVEGLIFQGAKVGWINSLRYNSSISLLKEFNQAVIDGDINKLEQVIKANPKIVNAKIEGKENALHYAINHGREDLAVTLINHGAELDRKTKHGNTALMFAALWGKTEVVKAILLKDNNGINEVNKQGQSALYLANMANNQEISQMLKEKGADQSLVSNSGKTPKDMELENIKATIQSQTVSIKHTESLVAARDKGKEAGRGRG